MKTTRTLRLLSLFGFLVLFAPFYDACDGKHFFSKVPEKNIVIEKSVQEKLYDVVVDEESFTAIEIAGTSLNGRFNEMIDEMIRVCKEKDWKNLSVFVSIIFDFIVLISLILIILSFTKRLRLVNKLALVNSALALITLLYIIILESSFEHIRQIKWGYYAFIITNLLLYYHSKPNKIKT
nr:hypothetical protein [uncultured Flavobacterium sp.]